MFRVGSELGTYRKEYVGQSCSLKFFQLLMFRNSRIDRVHMRSGREAVLLGTMAKHKTHKIHCLVQSNVSQDWGSEHLPDDC